MKKYFITGLVILLPLAVTIAIISFIINILTKPFVGMVSSLLSHFNIINKGFLFLSPEETLKLGSQFLILILLFFVTLGLGFIARNFFIKAFFRLGDRILHRIPIVNTVYKTTQDIIKTLFSSDKTSFKQVVMVPFPSQGIWAVGLVARESPQVCSSSANKELISVLILTTPNPTTGFLLMYKKEELRYVDMPAEDAVKYIVSCGIIVPEAPKAKT